jgi:hypothetical protein
VVTTIWSSLLLRRHTSRGASAEPISPPHS